MPPPSAEVLLHAIAEEEKKIRKAVKGDTRTVREGRARIRGWDNALLQIHGVTRRKGGKK